MKVKELTHCWYVKPLDISVWPIMWPCQDNATVDFGTKLMFLQVRCTFFCAFFNLMGHHYPLHFTKKHHEALSNKDLRSSISKKQKMVSILNKYVHCVMQLLNTLKISKYYYIRTCSWKYSCSVNHFFQQNRCHQNRFCTSIAFCRKAWDNKPAGNSNKKIKMASCL